MAVNIITQEDLEQFRIQFFEDQKLILEQFKEELSQKSPKEDLSTIKWLKSHQVQRLLGISPGTLQTLRINGTIPFSKIGGSIFFSPTDIQKLLESNKRNSR